MENSNSDSQSSEPNNPNNIHNIDAVGSIGGEVPTNSDKVYRYVNQQGAIEDIAQSGIVRNANSAGVKKGKNRWGDNVYWHRGAEGFKKPVNTGFVVEAPYSVASQRQVRAEDITGVYQNRMGKLTNLLEEDEIENRPRRSRGFSGEQSENKNISYRIGILGILFLLGFAFSLDLMEAILSLLIPGVGGYIKDFASYIIFPFLFWIFKIPFWKGNKRIQKMSTMIIGALIALIPVVSDVLPELTISVFVTIMYSRIEDKLGVQGKFLQKKSKILTAKRVREKIRR
jgi:hypothetical protein